MDFQDNKSLVVLKIHTPEFYILEQQLIIVWDLTLRSQEDYSDSCLIIVSDTSRIERRRSIEVF